MKNNRVGFNPTGAPAWNPGGAGQMIPVMIPGQGLVMMPATGIPGVEGGAAFDIPGGDTGTTAGGPSINFGAAQGGIELNFETESDPKWYLTRGEGLEKVTNERNNPELGVTDIKLFRPTTAQKNSGIVAKIQLVTNVATFNNLSIMGTKFDDTAIRLVIPSHEGTNGNWFEDYKLDTRVIAQVLSYVDTLVAPSK